MSTQEIKQIVILGIVGIGLGVSLISCPTQPTTPPEPATLSVEYTTCTEIWLRVQAPDTARQAGLRMYRDDSLVVNFPVSPADTVVIDDGLQPNTTYAYHTVRVQDGRERATSPPLNITTLDTTSNAFIWTIDTLGNPQYGSSSLSDVAIVDEDNIWAVGDIQTDSGRYNLAKWDGKQWHLIKIKPQGYVQSLQSIFTVNMNDIWFGRGSLPIHYNGKTSTMLTPNDDGYPGGFIINAIWGTSSSNLYFVGTGGSIVHYDGATFTKEISNVDTDFRGIWGTPTGDRVWACGFTDDQAGTYLLTREQGTWRIQYDGTHTEFQVLTDHWSGTLVGGQSWIEDELYVVSSAGVYRSTPDGAVVQRLSPYSEWFAGFPNQMAGNGGNDFWVVGNQGMVLHYNGRSWKEFFSEGAPIVWYSVAQIDQAVVAVGEAFNEGAAVVFRGYRGRE